MTVDNLDWLGGEGGARGGGECGLGGCEEGRKGEKVAGGGRAGGDERKDFGEEALL